MGEVWNKLWTYQSFKHAFGSEPYLQTVLNKKHRSFLAKLQCGLAPLHIETGHYVGRNLENRVCFNYPMDVESQKHVILYCNVYNDLRDDLFLFPCTIMHEIVQNLIT